MADIVLILDGQTLPDSHVLKEIITPIESDNVTLNGELYTDFVSVRRGWVVSWKRLSKADYDVIRGIFDDQYTNETYPIFDFAFDGISTPVKVSINERSIRFDGNCVENLQITLQEQFAVS